MKSILINFFASIIALSVLFLMVSSTLIWVSNNKNYQSDLMLFNLGFGILAVLSWTGILTRKINKENRPQTWIEWVAVFIGGLIISIIFILLDCSGQFQVFHPTFVCKGNPGWSVIFTISAIGVTVISIPSAIRSWIMKMFAS